MKRCQVLEKCLHLTWGRGSHNRHGNVSTGTTKTALAAIPFSRLLGASYRLAPGEGALCCRGGSLGPQLVGDHARCERGCPESIRVSGCRPAAQRRRCHRHDLSRPCWAASHRWIDPPSKLGCCIVRHGRCVELKQEMHAILRPKSDARPRSAMLGFYGAARRSR